VLRLLIAALGGVGTFLLGAALNRFLDGSFPLGMIVLIMSLVGTPAIILALWRVQSAIDIARKKGRLGILEFEVVAVCQVAETEDEGLHFFLETDDGKTRFVSGQFLYEPVHAKKFPRELVKVFIDTKSREVLDVESTGRKFLPWPVIDAFTETEHARDLVPDNLEILPYGIVEVLSRLERTPNS